LTLLLSVVIGLGLPYAADERPSKAPSIRLAVLVVFDQMRSDYLTRWDALFGDDGFHRLEKEGTWFQNCHYPYAHNVTSAGHTSLNTGTSPDKHGIVANEWYDRASGEMVYCAGSLRAERVPPAPKKEGKEKKPRGSGSPERLLVATLADAFRDATKDKGRVFSLSLKDRAAILPGGKRPDACYWLDTTDGMIVTSTYYRDRVHPWIDEFNKARLVDSFFGKPWQRLRSDVDYEKYSGPDDVKAEWTGYGQGRTFPHPMDGGLTKPGPKYFEALYNSPMGNEVLLDLVKRAIDAEKLGTREVPDLLLISFSCNDPVGHCWGPDSQEVLDTTLRSDRIVAALLSHLDARVGKGKYALVLSADHGVCPIPEVSATKGRDALRVSPITFRKEAEEHLGKVFGKDADGKSAWIEEFINENFYLNRTAIRAASLDQAKVEEELSKWAATRPGIQTAYTRTRLLKELDKDDAIGQRVRRSFHPERSGDVLLVTKPYSIMSPHLQGTVHGTPHSYDTHVPLIAYGPGIQTGVRKDAVTPQAGIAILARALGIKPPRTAEAMVPAKLFQE
jgi:predicted AlkP superfamily pyrophosphatase or phosphodiesterase